MITLRIKKLRSALGLTQSQFATKLGMTLRGVQKWEHGETKISDKIKNHMATIFNVNPEWLEFGTGDMFSKNYDPAVTLQYVDTNALGQILEAIEMYLDENDLELEYADKAALMIALYKQYHIDYSNNSKVIKMSDYLKGTNIERDISFSLGGGKQ